MIDQFEEFVPTGSISSPKPDSKLNEDLST